MAKRRAKAPKAPKKATKPVGAKTVDTLNVHNPGKTYKRDAVKYLTARKAFLALLPARPPGFTQAELMAAMRRILPLTQFPGTTTSWWMKTVQLDAEARGEVIRDGGKPLRWRKVK